LLLGPQHRLAGHLRVRVRVPVRAHVGDDVEDAPDLEALVDAAGRGRQLVVGQLLPVHLAGVVPSGDRAVTVVGPEVVIVPGVDQRDVAVEGVLARLEEHVVVAAPVVGQRAAARDAVVARPQVVVVHVPAVHEEQPVLRQRLLAHGVEDRAVGHPVGGQRATHARNTRSGPGTGGHAVGVAGGGADDGMGLELPGELLVLQAVLLHAEGVARIRVQTGDGHTDHTLGSGQYGPVVLDPRHAVLAYGDADAGPGDLGDHQGPCLVGRPHPHVDNGHALSLLLVVAAPVRTVQQCIADAGFHQNPPVHLGTLPYQRQEGRETLWTDPPRVVQVADDVQVHTLFAAQAL